MNEIQLFEGISRESLEAMLSCFKPEKRSFKKGETILVYSYSLKYLCVLTSAGPTSTAWTARGNTPCWSNTVQTTFLGRSSPCPTGTWAMPWRRTATAG